MIFRFPTSPLRRLALAAAVIIASALGMAAPARAVPSLQVYIEGATYDTDDETWIISASPFAPIRMWAIGNVDGAGGKGDLLDVRAAFAYSSGAGNVTLSIVPTTTGGIGGFTDPSVPGTPTLLGTHTDGSRPVLANGKNLSKHGLYGNGTDWQEWALGEFDLIDSPISDFVDAFPEAPTATAGQINVYEIYVGGLTAGESIHIDLYGYYMDNKDRVKAVFAPFSHDGSFSQAAFQPNPTSDPETASVPAPGALLFFVAGAAWIARRRRSDRKI